MPFSGARAGQGGRNGSRGRTARADCGKGSLQAASFLRGSSANSLRNDRQDLSGHVSLSFPEENEGRNIGCWRGVEQCLTIKQMNRVEGAPVFKSRSWVLALHKRLSNPHFLY